MKTKQTILHRAERMIAIYLLLRKKALPLITLSRRFKVNERSILRDLKLLREAGAPLGKNAIGLFFVDTKKD